jgi:dolichol-phosphate mannosyltransferase
MIRLLVPVDGSTNTAPIDGIASDDADIEIVAIGCDGNTSAHSIPRSLRVVPFKAGLPDFGAIHALLKEEKPDACVLLDESAFSRICGLAADLLSVSNIVFVHSRSQLRNLPYHDKPRQDLFLLTESKLFPYALEDPRYGSTLLPVASGESVLSFKSIMERWATAKIDPLTPHLSVVVPSFREGANIPLVCDRLLKALDHCDFVWEVLFVDDASPDDTYQRALDQMWRSPRIRALTKPTPRGMGNALRYGFKMARAPVVVVTMGDGSDEVDRIPAMFEAIRTHGYALAIGTRYRRRENYANIPWLYRFWSRGFRLASRLVTGLKLTDYTNAFRAFDQQIFSRYGPESGGFEISPEITFKAWMTTHRVTEVDVCHLKRTSGQSNYSFLKAGPGYFKILVKAGVGRLTGRWFSLDW